MQAPLAAANAINLTPAYPNFPNGDPLSLIGTRSPTYNNNGFQYQMRWPNAILPVGNTTSPVAVYAISENGGNTVRLSWNSSSPVLVNPQSARASFRVFFYGDSVGTGLGGDAYVNYALASSVVPCVVALIALLAVAL